MRSFAYLLLCFLLLASSAAKEPKRDKDDDGSPSAAPSLRPTPVPSMFPSDTPTANPSQAPSLSFLPTSSPFPSVPPTQLPTASPSTSEPTAATSQPTVVESQSPSETSSSEPTMAASTTPSAGPTGGPTAEPTTTSPTGEPSMTSTDFPTGAPTLTATGAPSPEPSIPLASGEPTTEFVGVSLPELVVKFSVYGGPISLDEMAIQVQRFIEDTVASKSAELGDLSHVTIYATVRKQNDDDRKLRGLQQTPIIPVAFVNSRVEGIVFFRNEPTVPTTVQLSEILIEYFANWGDRDLASDLSTSSYHVEGVSVTIGETEVDVVEDDKNRGTNSSTSEKSDFWDSSLSLVLMVALGAGCLAVFLALALVVLQRRRDRQAEIKNGTLLAVRSVGATDVGSANSSDGVGEAATHNGVVMPNDDDDSSTESVNLRNNRDYKLTPVDLDAYPEEMAPPLGGDYHDEMSLSGVSVSNSIYTFNTMATDDVYTLNEVYSVNAPTVDKYDPGRLDRLISTAHRFVEANSSEEEGDDDVTSLGFSGHDAESSEQNKVAQLDRALPSAPPVVAANPVDAEDAPPKPSNVINTHEMLEEDDMTGLGSYLPSSHLISAAPSADDEDTSPRLSNEFTKLETRPKPYDIARLDKFLPSSDIVVSSNSADDEDISNGGSDRTPDRYDVARLDRVLPSSPLLVAVNSADDTSLGFSTATDANTAATPEHYDISRLDRVISRPQPRVTTVNSADSEDSTVGFSLS